MYVENGAKACPTNDTDVIKGTHFRVVEWEFSSKDEIYPIMCGSLVAKVGEALD